MIHTPLRPPANEQSFFASFCSQKEESFLPLAFPPPRNPNAPPPRTPPSLARHPRLLRGRHSRLGLRLLRNPVFVARLQAEQGWSTSLVSGATIAFYLVGAVMVARMPLVLAAIGPRLVLPAGVALMSLGAITAGQAIAPWQMIAGFLIDSSKEYGFGRKDVAKRYADIDMVKVVGGEPFMGSPCRPQSARRMWMLSVLSLFVARWVTSATRCRTHHTPRTRCLASGRRPCCR